MQQVDATALNTLDRIRVFQHVNRVWRPYLSSQERDFLFYLLDNTICWGRTTLKVTIEQMVCGTSWIPPVGISERTVYRLMSVMRERGLIDAVTNGRVTLITLNLNWVPEVLRVPKRLRNGAMNKSNSVTNGNDSSFSLSDDATNVELPKNPILPEWQNSSAKLADQNCQFGSPIKEEALNGSSSKDSGAVRRGLGVEAQPSEPEEDVRPTSAIDAVAYGRSKGKRRRKLDIAPDNFTVWQDAWVLAYPKAPCYRWTRAETAMIRTLEKRASGAGLHWADFLSWAVSHWAEVRAAKFGWMRSPSPVLPNVKFLVGMSDRFFDAYADRSAEGRLLTATGEDAEIEQLMRSGLNREQALIEIGKRRGVAEQREEIDREKAEVARLLRVAERGHRIPVPPTKRAPAREVRVVHGDNPYEASGVSLPEINKLEWNE